MDDRKKKKEPTVYVSGREYPEKPGLLDRLKEGFEDQGTRSDLEVIRRRRAKYGS
jgi:hypothetical protein